MEQTEIRTPRAMWAFWIACGLLIAGGVAPILVGAGFNTRFAGVIIPFAIGAAAMGLNAQMYHQGRAWAAGLFLLAGFATVYGILGMLAVPVRLVIVGVCPNNVTACPPGFEHPLTLAENTGLTVAVAGGVAAILVGFVGLAIYYFSTGVRRRRAAPSEPPARAWPDRPPSSTSPAPPAAPKPEPVLAGAAVAPREAVEPKSEAPAELPELEAPPELLELPAPHEEPVAAAIDPAPKPRPRRARKPRPDAITPEAEPPSAG